MEFTQYQLRLMGYIKYSRLLSFSDIKNEVITYLFILITPFFCLCQNLVPNGSFNDINDCDVSNWSSSVQSVEFWYASIQSPDFLITVLTRPIKSPIRLEGIPIR